MRWLHISQSSFLELFFPVFIWGYFPYHQLHQHAPEYHLVPVSPKGFPRCLREERYNTVSGMHRSQSSSSESFSPFTVWTYFLFHHSPECAPKGPFVDPSMTVSKMHNVKKALSMWDDYTYHRVVSYKASFQFLSEAISLFTIGIHMLPNITWYLFPQKGFPDAVWEVRYNTMSGMHTSQNSSSKTFSAVSVWTYFLFHRKPQSAPEYPITR